jgi:hypothetical protein
VRKGIYIPKNFSKAISLLPMGQGERGNMKCNRDCFHCEYEDCICDDVSLTERIDQMERDINTQTEEKTAKYSRRRTGAKKGRVWNG